MLRLLGGVMIMAGSLGMGVWYKFKFRERIEVIELLIMVIELLSGEIRYCFATLPESCRQAGQRLRDEKSIKYNVGEALISVYAVMSENNGYSFNTVFRERMTECLNDFALENMDKDAFFSFLGNTGLSDVDAQLRLMEQSKLKLNEIQADLRQSIHSREKIAISLGAMSGLLLIIILL